ncbi:hypothetical protein HUJ04_005594 [Dendroctonus ponderosae]
MISQTSEYKDEKAMEAERNEPARVPWFGIRHVMTILLHTYLICNFLTRSTMSLAIVAMTDSNASSNPDIPTYTWNNTGVLLSAFYWSYVILQPFSGYIFIHIGFKWVVLGVMLMNIIPFMLIPAAVFRFGSTGLIVCRIVQGLFQGFCYPAIHHALGLWVPENERSLLCMIARAGNKVGYIIAMLSTGFISASWWGWPAVFYILGTISLIWCLFWAVLASDSPADHAIIKEVERDYIEKSLKTREKEDIRSVPFRAILTSLPFWAIAVANAGISWNSTLTENAIPTYLGSALGFDISSNGAVTASPSVVQLLINIPVALLGDYCVSRGHLSLWTWRRLAQAVGCYVPALLLIWLGFLSQEQRVLAVVLLNLNAIGAVEIFGSLVNHVDLSPRYAGVLLSIENTLAQVIAMFAPMLLDLATDLTDIVMWRWIFVSLSVIAVITGTFFILFGKAEIQWWNSKNTKDED